MKVLRTCPKCRFRGYFQNVARTGEDNGRPLLHCDHCKYEWFARVPVGPVERMKVRTSYQFAENDLRALASRYGNETMTRDDVELWMQSTIRASLEVIVADYEKENESK